MKEGVEEEERRQKPGGRRPLCLRTMGRGKGAPGGARRGGGASLPTTPRGTWLPAPLFPPPPLALCSRPPGSLTPLRSVALENPGVQTPTPSPPTQGGGP